MEKKKRNRKKTYETRLTVRIPMFLDGHVRQYCESNNIKLSKFIREALQTYLVYKDYMPTPEPICCGRHKECCK